MHVSYTVCISSGINCNIWNYLYLTRECIANLSYFYSKGILNECNTMAAEYLFQTDKHYDTQYDTGDKVIPVSYTHLRAHETDS